MTASNASISAFETIRNLILSGELSGGTRLTEEYLAEICEVSRTPVREALSKLAARDYVVIMPNSGTFVSEYSDEDIEEIFVLRAMLEAQAARLAAERATAKQIAEIKNAHSHAAEMLSEKGPPDRELWLNNNRQFHALIAEAAGSEKLSQMISRLVEQPIIDRTVMSFSGREISRSNTHHYDLVEAIERRDGNWAQATMSSHILAACQTHKHT